MLLTKNLEVLKPIIVKVGGAKESFSKELNRGEHLADPSSYGLDLTFLQAINLISRGVLCCLASKSTVKLKICGKFLRA